MGMMGGGGGGMMGMFGGGEGNKPYNLTFGINVNNLFNKVNRCNIQGAITSPFFSQATSTCGGFGGFGGGGGGAARRVNLSLRFNF